MLRVCRGVLGDAHAAEDAFRATFLVLFRQAGAIRKREVGGPWLHEWPTASRRAAPIGRGPPPRPRTPDGPTAGARATPHAASNLTTSTSPAVLPPSWGILPEQHRLGPIVLCDLEEPLARP